MSLRSVMDRVIDAAVTDSFFGCAGMGNAKTIQRYLKDGKEIPDWLLPGRFLQRVLRDEEREQLKDLTSESTCIKYPMIKFFV